MCAKTIIMYLISIYGNKGKNSEAGTKLSGEK